MQIQEAKRIKEMEEWRTNSLAQKKRTMVEIKISVYGSKNNWN
jgi:hypothetical protein